MIASTSLAFFSGLPELPPISIGEYGLLLAMAFVGGVMNSVAGGGSFFAFPALLAVRLPPINANATCSLAMWPGQIAGLTALRQELRSVRRLVVPVVLTSVIGGTAGAIALLHTRQATFMRLVPWLFLVGTTLFAFSGAARKRLEQISSRQSRAAIGGSPSAAFLFWMTVVGFYIGYFGAGSAILIFAVFAVCENVGDLRQVNALKVLCNVAGNGISVAAFIVARAVYWKQGSIMLLASIAGGYYGGKYSRKLPSKVMRAIVIVAGFSFAIYFFCKS